ncbi:hypothetical protein F4678DRAFT_93850 [Xylaria arbuscula]|nr:hypothetical protein F4678DRAFT_93850 [Xylaria arbuscula]
MGGLNLEVFKFGMYVMFPIGIMFYFGTNLDERFAVPAFWPKPEQANKVPLERDEIHAELQRLRARRLYLGRRLEVGESIASWEICALKGVGRCFSLSYEAHASSEMKWGYTEWHGIRESLPRQPTELYEYLRI